MNSLRLKNPARSGLKNGDEMKRCQEAIDFGLSPLIFRLH